MRGFGEAFTARQASEARRSHDLMSAARGVLGYAGIERVLALLKAGHYFPVSNRHFPVSGSILARGYRPGKAICGSWPGESRKQARNVTPSSPASNRAMRSPSGSKNTSPACRTEAGWPSTW